MAELFVALNRRNGLQAQTVCGVVPKTALGTTLAHDHLLFDGWNMSSRWGDYDSILDDVCLAIEEVILYRDSGGQSICDPTNVGIGRDPTGLRRISQATGVHILMGSGWYRERVYPRYVFEESPDDLAQRIVGEFDEGVADTGVKPGFIGEIGTERHHISPAEERVFRASARAQREIGCAVVTHTTNWGELALEQIDLLEEEGVPPDRIIVSHLGDRRGIDCLIPIAERGVWLGVDNLGFLDYNSLDVRADNVVGLWESGFGLQVLLSNDVCQRSQLSFFGGNGYANVLENFNPLLRSRGLSDIELGQMLVANPSEAFCIK